MVINSFPVCCDCFSSDRNVTLGKAVVQAQSLSAIMSGRPVVFSFPCLLFVFYFMLISIFAVGQKDSELTQNSVALPMREMGNVTYMHINHTHTYVQMQA